MFSFKGSSYTFMFMEPKGMLLACSDRFFFVVVVGVFLLKTYFSHMISWIAVCPPPRPPRSSSPYSPKSADFLALSLENSHLIILTTAAILIITIIKTSTAEQDQTHKQREKHKKQL